MDPTEKKATLCVRSVRSSSAGLSKEPVVSRSTCPSSEMSAKNAPAARADCSTARPRNSKGRPAKIAEVVVGGHAAERRRVAQDAALQAPEAPGEAGLASPGLAARLPIHHGVRQGRDAGLGHPRHAGAPSRCRVKADEVLSAGRTCTMVHARSGSPGGGPAAGRGLEAARAAELAGLIGDGKGRGGAKGRHHHTIHRRAAVVDDTADDVANGGRSQFGDSFRRSKRGWARAEPQPAASRQAVSAGMVRRPGMPMR